MSVESGIHAEVWNLPSVSGKIRWVAKNNKSCSRERKTGGLEYGRSRLRPLSLQPPNILVSMNRWQFIIHYTSATWTETIKTTDRQNSSLLEGGLQIWRARHSDSRDWRAYDILHFSLGNLREMAKGDFGSYSDYYTNLMIGCSLCLRSYNAFHLREGI